MNKTTKCRHCDKSVVLPFRCPYCNGYFCTDHRLPENHSCPESWRARAPRDEAPPVITEDAPTRSAYGHTTTYVPKSMAKVFWFSATELKHLAMGTVLVMGVGLSYIVLLGLTRLPGIDIMVSLAIAFTLSFLLHELAHKFSAQHFGLWAEFRLTTLGAFVTLISMLPTPFKIVSPGAVMIVGSATEATAGKTALSGPVTNIVLSISCVVFATTFQGPVFWIVAGINALIAFFNLIPFGIMDGRKVYVWNTIVWMIPFVLSFILMIVSYAHL